MMNASIFGMMVLKATTGMTTVVVIQTMMALVKHPILLVAELMQIIIL